MPLPYTSKFKWSDLKKLELPQSCPWKNTALVHKVELLTQALFARKIKAVT